MSAVIPTNEQAMATKASRRRSLNDIPNVDFCSLRYIEGLLSNQRQLIILPDQLNTVLPAWWHSAFREIPPERRHELTRNQRGCSHVELQRPKANVDDLDHVDAALRYRRINHGNAVGGVNSLQRQTRRID